MGKVPLFGQRSRHLRLRHLCRKLKQLVVCGNTDSLKLHQSSHTTLNTPKMSSHKKDVIVIDDDSDQEANGDMNFGNFVYEFDVTGGEVNEVNQPPPNPDPIPPQIAPMNCRDSVRAVFTDICPEYLERLADEYENNSDMIIEAILDSQEKGEMYPRQSAKNPLKRKRSQDDDDDDGDDGDEDLEDPESEENIAKDIRTKIAQPEYLRSSGAPSYKKIAVKLLSVDFPKVHMHVLKAYLTGNSGSVFKAYTAMKDAVRKCRVGQTPWPEKRTPTAHMYPFGRDEYDRIHMETYDEPEQLAIAELRAARELDDFKQEKVKLEAQEKMNFDLAKSAGRTEDCGCCFEECAINRMIHCDGETTHRFCRDCMKSQVETNIGLSKHELSCMSMDGCSGSFDGAQRKLFLDKKTIMALERLEFEASLRMAGIENLETCPFCPYAAEYPPPEVNKEFRCENPGCEKISCRLCRKESHIPTTCEENAVDHGLSARHVLEEAMSEALIRKCNKCQHPYVKLDGCNKVMCTRCRTLQCYVCRKTINSYNHFNDTARGGQKGQCPLFDKTELRHEEEIRQAEETTRKKVVAANPGLAASALEIKMSDQVRQDGVRSRSRRDPHVWPQPPQIRHPHPGPLPNQPGVAARLQLLRRRAEHDRMVAENNARVRDVQQMRMLHAANMHAANMEALRGQIPLPYQNAFGVPRAMDAGGVGGAPVGGYPPGNLYPGNANPHMGQYPGVGNRL
ncbi:hypothetical protein F5B19DRAFT_443173 [Rostrohypoxylon terebratum]|nr:hypothetical protein F5B19DRAFT_443173 [Rostrohypoxylon terebratum]